MLMISIPEPLQADVQKTGDTVSLPSSSPSQIIRNVIVQIEPESRLNDKYKKLAEALIEVKPGDIFSEEKIDASASLLRLTNRFENVHIEKIATAFGMDILFILTPHALIKDIKINKAYPLFTKDVEKVMTISVGDPFVFSTLAEQVELISRLYIKEGYIMPRVTLTAHKLERDSAYVVQVSIAKGAFQTLGKLDFKGNTAFSDTRLSLHMKSFRTSFYIGHGGRFRESVFLKGIENLIRFYRKKGYADVSITHQFNKNDLKNHVVNAVITIEEGPQYMIEDIDGNDEFFDRTLEKDLVFFEKGNKYNLGLRKSVQNIKTRYMDKGYPDISVKIMEEKAVTVEGEKRKLSISIHEGKQVIVDHVAIQGNTFFSDKKILKQVLTSPPSLFHAGVFLQETLSADMMAIKSLYLNDGFNDVEVSEKLAWKEDHVHVTVTLIIKEGTRTIVSFVQTEGDQLLSQESFLKTISMTPGTPFVKQMLSKDENELAAAIAEKGYPHVKVKGKAIISEDKKESVIIYRIDKGTYVKMGGIFLGGNFRTKEKVIQKELEMKSGEPFSLKKMVTAQKNTRDLNIFQSVRFKTIGIKENSDTVHLLADVIESPPYHMNAGAGYESQRGLYMHGKIGDQNLFGLNKKGWLSYESSEIGHRTETGLMDHRFLGYRTDAALTLYSERQQEFNQTFETRTRGATLGFTRKEGRYFTTGLNFKLERREQIYDEYPDETDINDSFFDLRTVFVTTPAISYDSRDGFVRPKKGALSTFSVDISRGLTNEIDNFYKLYLDNRYYYSPLSWLTFALLCRTGYLIPAGTNTDVPKDQLIYLGGTASVRGFRENRLEYDDNGDPIGGKAAVNTSIEARFEVGYSIELALFYDTGTLFDTPFYDSHEHVRHTVGTGIRYLTPIGPIGFLYGSKINPRSDEGRDQFHFSIGYTF